MVWLPLSYGMHRCVDHVLGAAISRSPTFIILRKRALFCLLLLLTILQ